MPEEGLSCGNTVPLRGMYLAASSPLSAAPSSWRRRRRAWLLSSHAARTIADTREYLAVAEELLRTENTAAGYFNAMVERYPDRLGRTVLWATAQAVFGIREHPGEDPAQFIAGGWL